MRKILTGRLRKIFLYSDKIKSPAARGIFIGEAENIQKNYFNFARARFAYSLVGYISTRR